MVFDFPMLFHFEQNGGHLPKTIGNQNKMSTLCSVFQWFGFRMVGTTALAISITNWPFQNQTIGNPNFKRLVFQCVRYFNVWILSPHCILYVNLNFRSSGLPGEASLRTTPWLWSHDSKKCQRMALQETLPTGYYASSYFGIRCTRPCWYKLLCWPQSTYNESSPKFCRNNLKSKQKCSDFKLSVFKWLRS